MAALRAAILFVSTRSEQYCVAIKNLLILIAVLYGLFSFYVVQVNVQKEQSALC